MSGQRESMGRRDYISSLPDEVLGKILSLLWTNRAACTSVLSKRWRNLYALVDNLELREGAGRYGPHGYFHDFVDKILPQLSLPIKRFSLTLGDPLQDPCRVCTWIRTALELGCVELYLEFLCLASIQPHFFFTSNTVVELTICNWHIAWANLTPGSMIFPSLKKLSLRAVKFLDDENFHGFISGFPLLQDLSLHYTQDELTPTWNGDVSNPSIKRLTIFNYFPDWPREVDMSVRFRTPCLEYLDYTSYVSVYYEVDLPSLVEARLDLRSWDNPNYHGYPSDSEDDDFRNYTDSFGKPRGDATGLVQGIRNVKTLHLSAYSLDVFYFSRKSMPVFPNLVTLSFKSDKERGWQVVPLLLNKSPNLETLVIKGLVHHVTKLCGDACVCVPKKRKNHKVCCLSTCRVKVLKILAYRGTCRERKQVRHFLANLKCLETVKVQVKLSRRQDKSQVYLNITNALLKLPKVSSNCQIHFF